MARERANERAIDRAEIALRIKLLASAKAAAGGGELPYSELDRVLPSVDCWRERQRKGVRDGGQKTGF